MWWFGLGLGIIWSITHNVMWGALLLGLQHTGDLAQVIFLMHVGLLVAHRSTVALFKVLVEVGSKSAV